MALLFPPAAFSEHTQHHVLFAQVGLSKLPDDTPAGATESEKEYNASMASGKTLLVSFSNFGEEWIYLGFDLSFSLFASSAKAGAALSEDLKLYYPALGLAARWPLENLHLESMAHVRVGPMIFSDNVIMDGNSLLISSIQPGYNFGVDLTYMPFKYVGIGVSFNRYLASVKELYSNYGDHVDLDKPFGLNRNEFAVGLVLAFDYNIQAPTGIWGGGI